MYVSFNIGIDIRHGILVGSFYHPLLGDCKMVQTPRSILKGQNGDLVSPERIKESDEETFWKHFDEVMKEEIASATILAKKLADVNIM